jgi:hypothetical protein
MMTEEKKVIEYEGEKKMMKEKKMMNMKGRR